MSMSLNVTGSPFLIPPSSRLCSYVYRSPENLRSVKANQLSTSPFVTLWFGQAGSYREAVVKWWCETGKHACEGCVLRLTTASLPNKYDAAMGLAHSASRFPSPVRLRTASLTALPFALQVQGLP